MSNIDPTVTENVEPTVQEPTAKNDNGTELEKTIIDYFNNNPQAFEKIISNNTSLNDIAKKTLTPWKDSHVSQGINTFKEKGMQDYIQKAINETRNEYSKKIDPTEALRIEFDAKFNEEKKLRKTAEIKANASQYITKLGMNLENVEIDDFITESEEETISRINRFYERDKKRDSKIEETVRKSFIKENNYVPPSGEKNEAVPFGGDPLKHAEAIRAGRTPKDGPEFERIRKQIDDFRRGKK